MSLDFLVPLLGAFFSGDPSAVLDQRAAAPRGLRVGLARVSALEVGGARAEHEIIFPGNTKRQRFILYFALCKTTALRRPRDAACSSGAKRNSGRHF